MGELSPVTLKSGVTEYLNVIPLQTTEEKKYKYQLSAHSLAGHVLCDY